jgi:hypothetical protein
MAADSQPRSSAFISRRLRCGHCYWKKGCFPDAESALYFFGINTTVGYGDLLLPKDWRLLGPFDALTGILMCGLPIGLFIAVLSRLYGPPN